MSSDFLGGVALYLNRRHAPQAIHDLTAVKVALKSAPHAGRNPVKHRFDFRFADRVAFGGQCAVFQS
jgi:hypothetical protein